MIDSHLFIFGNIQAIFAVPAALGPPQGDPRIGTRSPTVVFPAVGEQDNLIAIIATPHIHHRRVSSFSIGRDDSR